MAWHQTGYRPLLETMTTKFPDAYMLHLVSTHEARNSFIFINSLRPNDVCHMAAYILVNIASGNNSMSSIQWYAITWTNADIFVKFDPKLEPSIKILWLSFKKMHLKMLSAKCQPFLFWPQYVKLCYGHLWLMRGHDLILICFIAFKAYPDFLHLGPFYWHWLTLISAWTSNYIHCKEWDEITCPFSNFNGAAI